MSNHTPGPWHVDDDGAIRTADGRDVVAAFDHRVIATDADLRAIAALPELLALADAVIAWQSPVTMTLLAHVAQAKAKGELS